MSERGQASVEHAAIVLVVIAVLVGGGGLIAGWAPGIVNAVHSGIRRAICVAGGDRCAEFHEERPCVVARDEQQRAQVLSVAIFRLGKGSAVVREQRSDGRVQVTWYHDLEAGLTAGLGAELRSVREARGDAALVPAIGGGDGGAEADSPRRSGRGLSLSATAKVTAEAGWGRSWEFDDAAEADRFVGLLRGTMGGSRADGGAGDGVEALRRRAAFGPPDRDRVRLVSTTAVTGSVRASDRLSGELGLLRGLEGEASRERATGRLTVAIALSGGVAGRLVGPFSLDLRGRVQVEPSMQLTLDRDRRPLELRMLGVLGDEQGARRRELELRLDLTRPELARAFRGMLGGVATGRPGQAEDFAEELGRWAVTEGAIEQREYAVGSLREERRGGLAVGVKLGYERSSAAAGWRLVRARTKPPGGVWEVRFNCDRTA